MPQPALPSPAPAPLGAAADSTGGLADSVRSFVELATSRSVTGLDFAEALSVRLLSPALWIAVAGFVVKAVLTVLLALAVLRGVRRLARVYTDSVRELPANHPQRQRATTISALLVSAARYIVWPVAIITILDSAGLSVTSLVATAGFAGLAVGFGAQTLVRDVISGFFLLFDDTLSVGDHIRVGVDEGTVEFIGVRLIKVRKYDGELLMVPSGELRIFGNRSIGFARIVVSVNVPFTTPVEPVIATLHRVSEEWAEAHRDILLDAEPDVQGITGFGETSATARVVARVQVGAQHRAERDLRRRLIDALQGAGHEVGTGKAAVSVQTATTTTPPPAPVTG